MSNDTPIKVKTRYGYIWKHPKFTGCLIDKDNDIAWYKNGLVHREDGPAVESVESVNSYKAWCKNGKNHREDGPAVEFANGDKYWYLNGTLLTEQEHRLKVRQMKLKMLDTM